jgi:DNA-binding transcriptional MocR family regulator
MRTARDPFGEAVLRIRRDLRHGRYVQGERLAISDLADELRLSATPVREALARLSGEGLIEDRRGQGYFAWRLDVVDLMELYDLQLVYLKAALRRGRGPASGRTGQETAPPSLEEIFGDIVRLAGNGALARANDLLADRLAAPRLAEAHVLEHLDEELDRFLAARDIQDLLRAIEAYQVRRLTKGAAIISALRSRRGGASPI